MKKVLFALTLALLLTGCAAKEPDTTTPPSSEPPATGVYQENSSLEQATNGAVGVYHSPESLAGAGQFRGFPAASGAEKSLYPLGGRYPQRPHSPFRHAGRGEYGHFFRGLRVF